MSYEEYVEKKRAEITKLTNQHIVRSHRLISRVNKSPECIQILLDRDTHCQQHQLAQSRAGIKLYETHWEKMCNKDKLSVFDRWPVTAYYYVTISERDRKSENKFKIINSNDHLIAIFYDSKPGDKIVTILGDTIISEYKVRTSGQFIRPINNIHCLMNISHYNRSRKGISAQKHLAGGFF